MKEWKKMRMWTFFCTDQVTIRKVVNLFFRSISHVGNNSRFIVTMWKHNNNSNNNSNNNNKKRSNSYLFGNYFLLLLSADPGITKNNIFLANSFSLTQSEIRTYIYISLVKQSTSYIWLNLLFLFNLNIGKIDLLVDNALDFVNCEQIQLKKWSHILFWVWENGITFWEYLKQPPYSMPTKGT
jgi:hypothetical protein